MNSNFRRTTLEKAPSKFRRAFHRGWVDGQHNARWLRDYDRMTEDEQLGYEQGRLLAVEALAAGFALPVWRGDKSGARAVGELGAKVARAIYPQRLVPRSGGG